MRSPHVSVALLISTLCFRLIVHAGNSPSESTGGLAVATSNASAQFQANKAAADKGDVKAIFELARAYNRGLGVGKDLAKAVEYTRTAAERGYAPAEAALGSLYGRGAGVPQDTAEALRWYRKAADHGDALAQYAMGGFYEAGKIVTKDIDEAIRWFKCAADQGDAASQCELGCIYFTGIDTNRPSDFGEAVKWLQLAANQGYVGAMNNLGFAYLNALGGLPYDPVKGADLLQRAAEAGNPRAQASLGEMYRTGRGVRRDQLQAYVWLSLAKIGGNVDGKHSAPEVGALLTAAQLDRAEQLIADFLARQRFKTSQ